MNRISIRGAAAVTAMASTSIIAAAGVTAFVGDGKAAADTLSSGHRMAPFSSAVQGWTLGRSALEPTSSATASGATSAGRKAVVVHRRTTRSHDRLALTPRQLGRVLAAEQGWRGAQWTCLDSLWTRESNWRVHAENSRSGAYGIPQSLPARKMASFGSNWRTSARTQIRWGLDYIERSYGSPCRAWRHSRSYGFY